MNLPDTLYLVPVTYPRLGTGSGDITEDFDSAVDDYASHRDAGYPAAVYRLHPARGDMIDVTDEADALIEARMKGRAA